MNESWETYVLHEGARYATFWKEYLRTTKATVLYIGGRGFDPRAWTCLEAIHASTQNKGHVWEMVFGAGSRYAKRIANNQARLARFVDGATWTAEPIDLSHELAKAHGSTTAVIAEVMKQRQAEVAQFSDIVVDLTSISRVLGLALVHVLMQYYDAKLLAANIHVVVAENPEADRSIKALGYEQSVYHVHGFEAAWGSERCKRLPTAWIPLLGENEDGQIQAVKDFLGDEEPESVELLPAVPSPSANPRRGDDLLTQYRSLLFPADGSIAAQQIVYVAEANPFEACGQLLRAMENFEKVTSAHMGGARVAISLHSSKLLSLAALLAAYDAKRGKVVQAVTLLHMEPSHYEVDDSCPETGRPVTAWLRGSAYA